MPLYVALEGVASESPEIVVRVLEALGLHVVVADVPPASATREDLLRVGAHLASVDARLRPRELALLADVVTTGETPPDARPQVMQSLLDKMGVSAVSELPARCLAYVGRHTP